MSSPKSPSPLYAWLKQDVLTVAPQLLGWELVSQAGGVETAGRIVEVEAYHGALDPASHAHRGLTPRTAPMFEAGGGVYAYLSYGIHTCLNLVTGPAGDAQAVLIRALEPTCGLATMAERRRLPLERDPYNALGPDSPLRPAHLRRLTRGPGSLGQALGITLSLSGSRLGVGPLSLRPPATPLDTNAIGTGPRVGIRQAVDKPWRFFIAGNPFVSAGPRPTPPATRARATPPVD